MALVEGPYIQFALSFAGGTGVDTSFTVWRSLTPALSGFAVVGPNVPLLNERAFWLENTAPIGVDLYYRFVGDQTGDTHSVGPFQMPELGLVWFKDPLRPWADISLDTCPAGATHTEACGNTDPPIIWGGLSGLTAEDDTNLIPILNAERPADIYARRKWLSGRAVFFTRTLAAIDDVYALFTAGGPIQIQLPAVYGWADAFVQPGDLSWEYGSRDQRRPLRRWEFPFTIVDQPFGPEQGTDCNNWCAIEAAFTTFQDMTNYGGTWLSMLDGNVLCPDTPPELDGFGMGPFGDGPFGDGG